MWGQRIVRHSCFDHGRAYSSEQLVEDGVRDASSYTFIAHAADERWLMGRAARATAAAAARLRWEVQSVDAAERARAVEGSAYAAV